jgi:threonine/homoserine/homoserine lactone efflux protein
MLKLYLICTALGIIVSAPIGAVGTLCIRQCLIYGRLMGILSGFACALADGVYAALAAFGFSSASSFLAEHIQTIQITGIIILILNGIVLFYDKKSHLPEHNQPKSQGHHIKQLLSIFLVTVVNPATVIAVPGVMAASGILNDNVTHSEATAMVTGMITGTTIWWILMSCAIHKYRHKVNNKLLLHLNHITGALLFLGATAIAITL